MLSPRRRSTSLSAPWPPAGGASRVGERLLAIGQDLWAAGEKFWRDLREKVEGLEKESHRACIYLDYNATTPIFVEVKMGMEPYSLVQFGNPSSQHYYGRPCQAALQRARTQVAEMVGAAPSEIVFTSCGTESDNWALVGSVLAARRRRGHAFVPHIVTSAIEHPAVLECLKMLRDQGLASFTAVPCDGEGLVCTADVEAAVRTGETILISLMHSNNEVGSIQPVAGVAEIARRHGLLMHSDAAQSIGKVPVDVKQLGVDLLTIVGHKFGAPKGVAALYIRDGVELDSLFCGGGQERGRRSGTENVMLAAGLGEAAAVVRVELEQTRAHMAAMRDRLQALLLDGLPKGAARVNGPADASLRLPNTLSISVKGLTASSLLSDLSNQLAASAGAACHGPNDGSGSAPAVSGVLRAMHVTDEWAVGTLRLSTGRHTTHQDVEGAAELILEYVATHVL